MGEFVFYKGMVSWMIGVQYYLSHVYDQLIQSSSIEALGILMDQHHHSRRSNQDVRLQEQVSYYVCFNCLLI